MCKIACRCKCTAKSCIDVFKLLLSLLNIIFWLAGCAMLGLGIYLAVEDPRGAYAGMLEGLRDNMWKAVAFLIILGFLIFLIGILGCCAIRKDNSCMLCFYSLLMMVLLGMQIAVGVILIAQMKKIDKYLADTMEDQIKYDYRGPENDDTLSNAWDALQTDLDCCAANNYIDYRGSNYSETSDNPIPRTCCNSDDTADIAKCMDEARYYNGSNFVYLNEKGCYTTMTDWLDDKASSIYAVVFTIAAFELLAFIVGCFVTVNFRSY